MYEINDGLSCLGDKGGPPCKPIEFTGIRTLLYSRYLMSNPFLFFPPENNNHVVNT